MAFIPPRPHGSDPEARGLQAIWDIIWGPDSIFTDTPDVQFRKQASGKYIAKVKPPPAIGKATAGLKLRGEWDPDGHYSLNDVTVISLGINQGTFVYISPTSSTGMAGANPTTAPYTGGQNWMELPGGALGQWF